MEDKLTLSSQAPAQSVIALEIISKNARDCKKSAEYYKRHREEILIRRKARYQSDKENLQKIQRAYARAKREATKKAIVE